MKLALDTLIEDQKEFQRGLGWPIDSVSENDRNELSEKYIFKMIEEAVELRREFPSVVNPWSKHQKAADLDRIKEELSDVILFLMNFCIVWKLSPAEVFDSVKKVQLNNFRKVKERKMSILNADILKIPNRVAGIGSGSLFPRYVFIGQNPGKSIIHGYKFWSDPEDGSSQVLLPALTELGISRDKCYFTNIVKCITPDNTEPDEELTKFYLEFLEKELEILKLGNSDMKVITVGSWASKNYQGDTSIKHPAVVLYGQMDKENYSLHVSRVLGSLLK